MRALPFLLATIAFPLAAQQPRAPAHRPNRPAAAAAVRGPTVEGITEYNLPNGLRVLLFPDASKPTITVNITYLVGSRHEGYGETGMAHLLEHMLFKGTPRHRNIPQELTAHGARPNGTTWFDRTNYFETFAASDANLVWALDLEADRMVNSFIAEEGSRDPSSPWCGTSSSWGRTTRSSMLRGADPLDRLPLAQLRQLHHRRPFRHRAACRSSGCRPSTGGTTSRTTRVLVVAGKFDPKRDAAAHRARSSARIPRPTAAACCKIYPTYTVEPTQDGERSVTLRRVGDVQVVTAAYHVPSGSDPDFAAVRGAGAGPGRRAIGPAVQGAGGDQARPRTSARCRSSCGSPGRSSPSPGSARRLARQRAGRPGRARRTRWPSGADRRGGGARQGTAAQATSS